MAKFYRTSALWVVDFLYDGRPRRWYKTAPAGRSIADEVAHTLADWYGHRARLVSVREANADEEAAYRRGEEPRNVYCPTGREPVRR